MKKLIIECIEGRWRVNGKPFSDMSPNESQALALFIKEYDYGNYRRNVPQNEGGRL